MKKKILISLLVCIPIITGLSLPSAIKAENRQQNVATINARANLQNAQS